MKEKSSKMNLKRRSWSLRGMKVDGGVEMVVKSWTSGRQSRLYFVEFATGDRFEPQFTVAEGVSRDGQQDGSNSHIKPYFWSRYVVPKKVIYDTAFHPAWSWIYLGINDKYCECSDSFWKYYWLFLQTKETPNVDEVNIRYQQLCAHHACFFTLLWMQKWLWCP